MRRRVGWAGGWIGGCAEVRLIEWVGGRGVWIRSLWEGSGPVGERVCGGWVCGGCGVMKVVVDG